MQCHGRPEQGRKDASRHLVQKKGLWPVDWKLKFCSGTSPIFRLSNSGRTYFSKNNNIDYSPLVLVNVTPRRRCGATITPQLDRNYFYTRHRTRWNIIKILYYIIMWAIFYCDYITIIIIIKYYYLLYYYDECAIFTAGMRRLTVTFRTRRYPKRRAENAYTQV